MEVRRRGFLLGMMAGGACAGAVGKGTEQAAVPTYGVCPPGSGGFERLRKLCTGCNLCVAKCTNKVIRAATLEHGIAGTMMPVMDFSRGYCDKGCTACGRVCPTGAIRHLTKEEKKKTVIAKVELSTGWEKKCLADGKRKDACGLCEANCRYDAIKIVGDKKKKGGRHPVIDRDKCVGCGACVYFCPEKLIKITPYN